MSSDSSPWGRIDADGTVYVTSAGGERVIGSWQAGDADAGMAYYIRRFEDLETEVSLLEQRLGSGAGDPASTRTQALALKEQLPQAAAIGDLDSLAARVDALLAPRRRRPTRPSAARRQARADAAAAKEALAVEAEQIAERAIVVEGVRRSAARDRRGMEADQGRRPQDRRRALEAVLGRPRRVRPAPRRALRRARHRADDGSRRRRRSWSRGPRSWPSRRTGRRPPRR